jgi:serine/threonine protein phosphatase PrpC
MYLSEPEKKRMRSLVSALLRRSKVTDKTARRKLVESVIDIGIVNEKDVRFLCSDSLTDISAECYQRQMIFDRL